MLTKPSRVDVAVVGAGPAGLSAALSAAQGGLNVKLFEKKKEIGNSIACGEFLPSQRELAQLIPRAKAIPELFDVPEDCISNRSNRIRIYSPRGQLWEFEFEGFILDRQRLEEHLAERCLNYGVEVAVGTRADLYRVGEKTLVGQSMSVAVEAGVVVAADGFPSLFARKAGFPIQPYGTWRDVAVCLQYRMEGLDLEDDVVEMHFGSDISPGGYAWVIPKGGGVANVGLGVRTRFAKREKNPLKLLTFFVNSLKRSRKAFINGRVARLMGDVLPMDGPLKLTFSDHTLLVGDAAGMVMPTNGGGIPTAMLAGRIAGEVAAMHLNEGTHLSRYEIAWKGQLGRELYTSASLRRVADRFMKNDLIMHWALSMLGRDGIREVTGCRDPLLVKPLVHLFGRHLS